jgi:hypothetical protein
VAREAADAALLVLGTHVLEGPPSPVAPPSPAPGSSRRDP